MSKLQLNKSVICYILIIILLLSLSSCSSTDTSSNHSSMGVESLENSEKEVSSMEELSSANTSTLGSSLIKDNSSSKVSDSKSKSLVKSASESSSQSTKTDFTTKVTGKYKKASKPEIYMGMKKSFALGQALESGYKDTVSKVNGCIFFIDQIGYASLSEIRDMVYVTKKYELKVSIEAGALYNHEWGDECGEKSAARDLELINKWTFAGGKIDYLGLDGPIRRTTVKGQGDGKDPNLFSVEKAANELADYMELIKEKYPDVKFNWVTNFPNWAWKGEPAYLHYDLDGTLGYGDFSIVMPKVIDIIVKRKLKFNGLEVDNPYNYYCGDTPTDNPTKVTPKQIDWKKRVTELEDMTRKYGMEFIMILNSASGNLSEKKYYEDTLDYIDEYRARGGKAEKYFIESWYPYPEEIAPDTTPYTLTYLIKEILKRLGL